MMDKVSHLTAICTDCYAFGPPMMLDGLWVDFENDSWHIFAYINYSDGTFEEFCRCPECEIKNSGKTIYPHTNMQFYPEVDHKKER